MFLSFMTKAPGSNTYGFAQSSFDLIDLQHTWINFNAVCKLYFAQNSFIHLCPILGQSTFVTIWISITSFRSRPISIVLFRCVKINGHQHTPRGIFSWDKEVDQKMILLRKRG